MMCNRYKASIWKVLRRNVLSSFLLATVIVMLLTMPVLAYLYRAPVAVSSNISSSYDMLPLTWDQNNVWLAANGFMHSSANDTRVQTLAGSNKPWMVADNKTLTAISVPATSQTNLYFTTGETELPAMDIITGYNGYITVADNTSTEVGDNFTITMNNIYLNTDNGTDKNIIRKDDAFYLFTSNTTSGNVTATIPEYNGTETLLVNGNGSLQEFDVVFGAATHWQAVLTIDDDTSYIGNTAFARKEDLFTVTDTALNTGAVIDNVTVTMRIINASTGRTALKTHGTTYYGGSNNPEGVWRTYTQVYATNPNTGLAWTFDEINDMEIGVNMESVGVQVKCTYVAATIGYHYNAVSTTLTGITTGEYDISVSANTTHLILNVDGTSNSTALGGASVPDNSNDWILFENNSVAYCGSFAISVNGTEQLRYEPDTIILGTNLPDITGSNNGTITWGSNPAGIAITLGSMISSGQTSMGSTTDTSTSDILPVTGTTDWRPEPTVSAALQTNPFRPIITAVSDNTTLSEYQVWVWFGIIIVIFATALVGANVRGHHLITGIAASVAIVLMIVWDIFPWLVLPIIILAIVGGLVSERSHSL